VALARATLMPLFRLLGIRFDRRDDRAALVVRDARIAAAPDDVLRPRAHLMVRAATAGT